MFRDLPLFFRLWFAFWFLMAAALIVGTIAVLSNPQWIGEFVGQIVQGYNSAT